SNLAGPVVHVAPSGLLDRDAPAAARYRRCLEDSRRNTSVGCLSDALEDRSRGLNLGQPGQAVTRQHPVTTQERGIYIQCMEKRGYAVSALPDAYEHPSQ